MEIKTKYNIGDVVFYIERADGEYKIMSGEIKAINFFIGEIIDARGVHITMTQGYAKYYIGLVSEEKKDNEIFLSKEELFENIKNAVVLILP